MKVLSYKGKKVEKDEWAVGAALPLDDGRCLILRKNSMGIITSYEVDPNSISLSTGEKDKYSNEVFTEDFIKVTYPSGQALFGIVKYGHLDEGMFSSPISETVYPGLHIDWIDCNYEKSEHFIKQFSHWFSRENAFIEVIGNSFDNPELFNSSPLPEYTDPDD